MKILTVMLLLFVFYACSDEWKKKEEVTGDGLKRGTPYEILEGRGNYTIFLDAINRIGYRDLLDGKGLSTLFVPDDDAFNAYFKKHNIANGLDGIDSVELSQLVGQHIMRFAYRRQELTNFQPQTGMEDLPGVNYKHPTVVTPPIRTFYNEKVRRDVKVYSNTRYLPVFTSNLFSSLGIGESYNYEYFYPNSTWKSERGIAAANAQLTSDEIETDNGYLYTIDQVIEPLHTVYEAMENDERFSIAKSIFDKFLTFTYNANASKKYAAVGDSLFTIGTESTKNFPLSCLADEWTSNGVWETPQFSTAYNAFIPTNEAMEEFFQDYWKDPQTTLPDQYDSYDTMDKLLLYYLLENHILVNNPAFPDRIKEVIRNSWGYKYTFDPDVDAVAKEMCVNGAFIGINKVQAPAIFNAVTRQVFQSPSYHIFAYMLAKSGLLPSLANAESEVTLFIPSDAALAEVGYTINDPGTTLENVAILLNGSSVASSVLTDFVNNHILPFKLTDDILNGTPTWYETQKQGSDIQIGEGKILLEDASATATIVNSYAKNDAYEVSRTLSPALTTWLALVEKDATYTYRTWHKSQLKEKIIKSSNYFPGSQANPLSPFASNRGVYFTSHDSWGIPGQNDVPESKGQSATSGQKLPMTEWLAKHMVRPDENPNMKLVDFQTGNLVDKTYQTINSDVSIKILEVKVCEDVTDPVSGQLETELGRMKLTIEVTSKDKETRTAVAYGPHLASECVFFVIRNPEERFVYSE